MPRVPVQGDRIVAQPHPGRIERGEVTRVTDDPPRIFYTPDIRSPEEEDHSFGSEHALEECYGDGFYQWRFEVDG
jgi:hypothetical protein